MSKYEQDDAWEKRDGRLDEARERIRQKIAERKAAGTYRSAADVQAEWEKRVAEKVGPLVEALKRGIRESEGQENG